MGSEKPYLDDTDQNELPFDSLDEYISYLDFVDKDTKLIEKLKKEKQEVLE